MTVNFDFLDTPDPLAPKPYIGIEKDEVEHQLARQVEEAFLLAVVATKLRDWNALAQDWVKNGWNGAAYRREISHTFQEVFQEGATATLVEAALHGHKLAQDDFTTPITPDQRVITSWGQVYGSTLAERLALGSELAIQDVVNDGINARLPANVLADRARSVYGLDQRSNNTVKAYLSNKILPKNMTIIDVIAQMAFQRSQLVATNEVFSALNFGRQITYMQAMDSGLLEINAMKTWVTALDERVCPVCRPMDGVSVPINQPFEVLMPLPKTGRGKNRKSVQFIVPPVHPNCRCTIVPAERLTHGIITRTARYDDDLFGHGRLLSDKGDLKIQKGLFDESKHKRDEHGKFRRYMTDAALVGAVGAAGLKTATGRNIIIHVIGEKNFFNHMAKPMVTPMEDQVVSRGARWVLRDAETRAAYSDTWTQLEPLMDLRHATNFGQPGIYHPRAYKHLEGSNLEETLAKVEEHIRHQGVEHGVLIAPTGKIISFSRGDTSSAPLFLPRRDMKAYRGRMTWTHNHPHVHGHDVVLSSTDMAALHLAGVHRMRAVTPRGVVSQVRVHPSATISDTLDFANRASAASMDGTLAAHRKRFPNQAFDPKNPDHLNATAAYQSTKMHEFYQQESKKGKFIYSVSQPKVADKAS